MSLMTHDTIHSTEALARLLQQYVGKPNIQGLLNAFVGEIQLAEDQIWNVFLGVTLSGSSGTQLDNMGKIVGIDRQGLDDPTYRLRIQGRIQINISTGTPEGLIAVFKILSVATNVYLQEHPPADISLYSDGNITTAQITVVQALMELAASAGVRVAFIGQFDAINPFSFDGTLNPLTAPQGGFGDANDPTQGGLLGNLYLIGPAFGMAGTDPTLGGFSDYTDPVEGGYFSV